MNRTIITTICAILCLTHAASAQSRTKPTLAEVYNQGRVYFTEQRFEEARKCFLAVVKTAPKHQQSQWYLEQISRAELAKYGTKLERMMGEIMITEFTVRDGRIDEVLARLRIETKKITKGKFQPNFVAGGLSEDQKKIPLNFSLRNVSLKAVLKQVSLSTGAHFDYGTHLISVRQKAPTILKPERPSGRPSSPALAKQPSKLNKGKSPTLRKDDEDADDPFDRNKMVLRFVNLGE